jgi:hypothetical protein
MFPILIEKKRNVIGVFGGGEIKNSHLVLTINLEFQ